MAIKDSTARGSKPKQHRKPMLYGYARVSLTDPDPARQRGGLVILLTWLYLSSLMVLLRAIINAQSERQTRKDSTKGSRGQWGGARLTPPTRLAKAQVEEQPDR